MRLVSSLNEVDFGCAFDGVLVVKESFMKPTRNQSMYLHFVLTDGSRTIKTKKCDYAGAPYRRDMVVKLDGTVEEYNGRLDLTVLSTREVRGRGKLSWQLLASETKQEVMVIKSGALRGKLYKPLC